MHLYQSVALNAVAGIMYCFLEYLQAIFHNVDSRLEQLQLEQLDSVADSPIY